MHNIAQAAFHLTAENTELISRFVQIPEMQAMVHDHARRTFFAQQFSKSLLGLV